MIWIGLNLKKVRFIKKNYLKVEVLNHKFTYFKKNKLFSIKGKI